MTVTLFGPDWVFKDVIEVISIRWALNRIIGVLVRENTGTSAHREKMAM